MNRSSKILWGEGLFLRPQHFQRQDLYHETRLSEFGRVVHPYLWGVQNLKIDTDALATGILRLNQFHAVMPDGELVDAPEQDELPNAVNLASIEDIGSGILFYVALSRLRDYGSNFARADDDAGQACRYRQHNQNAPDLYTNAIEADISTLKKSLRLLSERDNHEQYICIPVARIRTTSSGGYELDPAFISPSLSILSSPGLYQTLRRVIEILQAKAQALYGHHRQTSGDIIEFRSGDIASFWLLHTVNSACASLQHLFQHPALHPERLFQEMLNLAGQLLTFSKTYTLADLPVYRHADPAPAFAKLDRIIRDLIDTVISSHYFLVALSEVKPAFYLGRLDSEKVTSNAALYLSVSADMPPAELVERIPQRIKIGAPDDVDKMVSSALPGVRLQSAPQVPPAIPVRPGCYYFSIEPHGSLYERMIQANSVMIYAPTGFANLKLELYAVTQ